METRRYIDPWREAMTKQRLGELNKRIVARIAQRGLTTRPASDADKRRMKELRQQQQAQNPTSSSEQH